MNVGPPWANLAVAVLGSLVAGAPLTAVNIFLLALLILIWLMASRLPGALPWPTFLVALLAVLGWVSVGPTPGFVFVLHSWPAPYGWLAAVGAWLVALWVGAPLRHHDPVFRAAATGGMAIYFTAVMSALVLIQAELALA